MERELKIGKHEGVNTTRKNMASPKDVLSVPIRRYTYTIFAGLAMNFPREVKREGPASVINRLGQFAPFAVGLNEAADCGVSAELFLKAGVDQDKYVPLLQLKNNLMNTLKKREEVFLRQYPEHRRVVDTMREDFLLLSRIRDSMDAVTFLELDSGIFEAGYAAVAFPQEDILTDAGVEFPGEHCRDGDDLIEKYSLYLLSNGDSRARNGVARKVRKLHATEMVMKVDDDEFGVTFDRQVGLPSFSLWSIQESIRTGEEQSAILERKRRQYIDIASGGSLVQEMITRTAALTRRRTGKSRNRRACAGIKPTEDLWQLGQLTDRLFTPGNTGLRHQLEAYTLVDRAFNKRS